MLRRGRFVVVTVVACLLLTVPATSAVAIKLGGAAGGAGSSSAGSSGGRAWTLGSQNCRLIGVPAARASAPVGVAETCPGVRPGAAVFTATGRCTLNFMWKGDDGATYMGTAGHCILGISDAAVVKWPPGTGPVARDGTNRRIGTFAFAALTDSLDFSLIRLDPEVAATASPQVCHFGGPTAAAASPSAGLLAPLTYFGQGNLTGTVVPARTAFALDGSDERALVSLGAAAPGDSGSPVTNSDGQAFGVLVATGPAVAGIVATGVVITVPLAPQIEAASRATGVGYTLQTAPRA